jgi:hypothetical protein
MKLFTVPKVPMYCEGITHRIEKRKSGETKIVELALRRPSNDAQCSHGVSGA